MQSGSPLLYCKVEAAGSAERRSSFSHLQSWREAASKHGLPHGAVTAASGTEHERKPAVFRPALLLWSAGAAARLEDVVLLLLPGCCWASVAAQVPKPIRKRRLVCERPLVLGVALPAAWAGLCTAPSEPQPELPRVGELSAKRCSGSIQC